MCFHLLHQWLTMQIYCDRLVHLRLATSSVKLSRICDRAISEMCTRAHTQTRTQHMLKMRDHGSVGLCAMCERELFCQGETRVTVR